MIANNAKMERALQEMELELKVLNYAKKTQKTYLACFRKFCAFYRKSPTSFNLKEIKNFLISKQNDGCAPQTVNLYLNSLKFYYRHVLKSKTQIDLRFAKRNKKIPIVLSRIEITRLISHIKNPKHKLIISLAYGSGLRVSEVTNLRVQDLDFQQQIIHLKISKGSRERITVLSKKIIPHLSQYVASKPPNDFVFESNRGGKLSTRTLQKVFSNSLIHANIKKQATFHSLRHAFATHLLENGTDIFYIQKLLGHRNIQTTQIYTRITNPSIKRINSPF